MNIYNILICFIILGIEDILINLFTTYRASKKCNYDCNKCNNWNCQYKLCEQKRKKLINKNDNK